MRASPLIAAAFVFACSAATDAPTDAGHVARDAGVQTDAGHVADAGQDAGQDSDAGLVADAGPFDAGEFDAGPVDAGEEEDGGTFVLAMPDFSLEDVNPASATGGKQVTPRDQLGHISGWYFAHAT